MSNDPTDSLKPNVGPYNLVKAYDEDVLGSRNPVLLQTSSQNDIANPIDNTKFSKITQKDLDDARQKILTLAKGEKAELITLTAGEKAEVDNAEVSFKERRNNIAEREKTIAFEFGCTSKPLNGEDAANEVIQRLRKDDLEVYNNAEKLEGYAGQEHTRFPGDRFLLNAPYIEKTRLFRVMEAMPKGAHLHIHFNANLLPHVLLDIAKTQEHMYIMSDIPLISKEGFERCSIRFSILSTSEYENVQIGKKGKTDLFSSAKKPGELKDPHLHHVMLYKTFREKFVEHYGKAYLNDSTIERIKNDAELINRFIDEYLTRKIVFQPDEAYNPHQTAQRAWERFNIHTQMMKGLFNYVTAYKVYTRKCLEEFVKDRIQYAEIRPNFMLSNQVLSDDGQTKLDNKGIMDLIIDVYEKFQETHKHQIFKGLKVIYCTPRSFIDTDVEKGLNECLDMKLTPRYRDYIAGFDLVGEEGAGQPLKAFTHKLLEFKAKCVKANVNIPFLFHCGETLDVGTETDGNLIDALLLGSKRIGHGFALAWHPYVMQQMKKNNVCVEVCPISNEILGLTPRISGHTVYNLLANDVHCTVSTDNGTLFRSRLTHDLYQIMIGKADMTLHGLRQLLEWSIEHSCMDEKEKADTMKAFRGFWVTWCKWVTSNANVLEKSPSSPSFSLSHL